MPVGAVGLVSAYRDDNPVHQKEPIVQKEKVPFAAPHSATKGITKGVVDKRQIAWTLSTVSLASATGWQDSVKYRTVEAGKVSLP